MKYNDHYDCHLNIQSWRLYIVFMALVRAMNIRIWKPRSRLSVTVWCLYCAQCCQLGDTSWDSCM